MSDLNTGAKLLNRQTALLSEATKLNAKTGPSYLRELKMSVLSFQRQAGDQSNLHQVRTVLLRSFPPVLHDMLEAHISKFMADEDFPALVAGLKSNFMNAGAERLIEHVEANKVLLTLCTAEILSRYKLLTESSTTPTDEEILLMLAIASTVRQSLPSKWTRLFRQIQGRTGPATSRAKTRISYTLEGVEKEFSGTNAKRQSEKYAASVIGEAYAKEVYESGLPINTETVESLLVGYPAIFGRERGERPSHLAARERPSGFFTITSPEILSRFETHPILHRHFNRSAEHQEICLAVKIFANFCEDLGGRLFELPF